MDSVSLLQKCSAKLRDQGFIISIPDELREAYSKGVFYLADLDEIPIQKNNAEQSLYLYADSLAVERIVRGRERTPIARSRFEPLLASDLASAEWQSLEDLLCLQKREIKLVAFPDRSAADIVYFPLRFQSSWKPHGRLTVLTTQKGKPSGSPAWDYDLNPHEPFYGAILICKRFFEAKTVREICGELSEKIKNASPDLVIEIFDTLEFRRPDEPFPYKNGPCILPRG